MPWNLATKINATANNNAANQAPWMTAARAIMREIELLRAQKCPYCDGFGHSGNMCPTDAKLTLLRRGGTTEMRQVLTQARKDARADANLGDNRNYSKLSASLGQQLKKRPRPNQHDYTDLQPPQQQPRR